MSLRLIGPLYDLSARGELFRRYCFLFVKLGIPFTIKIVPEENSKIQAEENIDAIRIYVTDIDPTADKVISFSSLENCHLVIQERSEAKKILYFYAHSASSVNSAYLKSVELFDDVWCANDFSYVVLNNINKDRKNIIGVPIDKEDSNTKIKLTLPSDKPITSDTFIFYSIGRFCERNNFRALLEAYWSAFTFSDDVCLVVKTYIDDHTQKELEYIRNFIDFLIQEGGHKNTPNVLVLHDVYPKKVISGLHKLGHCYVDCKRADYLGLNRLDAASFGNMVIQPEKMPVIDNDINRNVFDYKTFLRPVFSEKKPYFYPKQVWLDADVEGLSVKMIQSFTRFKEGRFKKDPYFKYRNTEEEVKSLVHKLL